MSCLHSQFAVSLVLRDSWLDNDTFFATDSSPQSPAALHSGAPKLSFVKDGVNVEAPGTQATRSYSMANAPHEPDVIELIVKVLPNGVFSGYLEREAAPGDHIRVEGPFGTLKVRLSHRRILMIAGGSGMAPLLAMLTDLAAKGNERPVTFFFGARTVNDLYCRDRIAQLSEKMAIDFVPVLSESWPDDWEGEIGFVTDAVARRLPNLEGYDAYLCGPPPMIDAATPMLIQRGVRPRNIYFDALLLWLRLRDPRQNCRVRPFVRPAGLP